MTLGLEDDDAMAGTVVTAAPMSDTAKAAAAPPASDLATLSFLSRTKLAGDYISER